ncbi:MAG: cellulose-binding domain-containing protein [Clostridia bacterium]|nr:cellulose-binding domain-containing protein [Clostridia bacterium]
MKKIKKGLILLVVLSIFVSMMVSVNAATTNISLSALRNEITNSTSLTSGTSVVLKSNHASGGSYLRFNAKWIPTGSFGAGTWAPFPETSAIMVNSLNKLVVTKLPTGKVALCFKDVPSNGTQYLYLDANGNTGLKSLASSAIPTECQFSPGFRFPGMTSLASDYTTLVGPNQYSTYFLCAEPTGAVKAIPQKYATTNNAWFWSIYKTFDKNLNVAATMGTPWANGYTASYTITNPNTESVNGWTLEFDLASSNTLRLPSYLKDTPTTTGTVTRHKIKGISSWIENIPAGGSVTLDFNIDGNTSNVPGNYTLTAAN